MMYKENLRYLNTPIGVFDSGVGGLSVLSELEKFLPNEHYIYYGDSKNLPYGNKTQKEIITFGKNTVNFFKAKGAKHIIMACNTSSALAYEALEEEFGCEIKIYPIIQNVAKNIAMHKKIGIMATVGTVKSGKYSEEILKINPNAKVFEEGCEKFVEIVENRLYSEASSINFIEKKLNLLVALGVEKIVLGCTHYPYLLPILTKFANENTFINPSIIFAKNISNEIKNYAKTPQFEKGEKEFFTSGNPAEFAKNAEVFYKIKNTVKEI